MKVTFLSVLGGVVMLSWSAAAAQVTCQSLLTGTNNFGELEASNSTGGCDIGNVNFDDFVTSFTAANVAVAVDGGPSSSFGQLLGLTYNYYGSGGAFPAGSNTIGYTAMFDPNAATDGAGGLACPTSPCGIDGIYSQLNAAYGDGAIVTTVDSGGYVGSHAVSAVSNTTETFQLAIPIIAAPASITKLATYNGMGTGDTFSTEVSAGTGAPEPSTMVLLGGAVLGLGILRRRKLLNQ